MSDQSRVPYILVGVVLLVSLALVAAFMVNQSGPFSRLESFPHQTYVNAPENLMGNRYRVEAQIQSQFSYREGVGRLIEISSSEADTVPLAVFVPEAVAETLHVGQRYHMAVMVQDGGLLVAEHLEKF